MPRRAPDEISIGAPRDARGTRTTESAEQPSARRVAGNRIDRSHENRGTRPPQTSRQRRRRPTGIRGCAVETSGRKPTEGRGMYNTALDEALLGAAATIERGAAA